MSLAATSSVAGPHCIAAIRPYSRGKRAHLVKARSVILGPPVGSVKPCWTNSARYPALSMCDPLRHEDVRLSQTIRIRHHTDDRVPAREVKLVRMTAKIPYSAKMLERIWIQVDVSERCSSFAGVDEVRVIRA